MRKSMAFILILITLFYFKGLASAQNVGIDQIKKTTIFLGELNTKGEPEYKATGFLVSIKNVFHLVTAKHVVMENVNGKFTGKMIDSNLYVFFNTNDGKLRIRSLAEIKLKYKFSWIFYPNNENVDIAIIPFDLNIQNDNVKVIPEELFLDTDRLFEIYDIYFGSRLANQC